MGYWDRIVHVRLDYEPGVTPGVGQRGHHVDSCWLRPALSSSSLLMQARFERWLTVLRARTVGMHHGRMLREETMN